LLIEWVTGSEASTEASTVLPHDQEGSTPASFVRSLRVFIRPLALAASIFVGLLLLVVVRVRHLMDIDVQVHKALYVGLWALILVMVLLSSLYSLALLPTLLIEVLVVLAYAIVWKRSRLRWATAVVIVNLITQPLLWLVVESFAYGPFLDLLAATEVGVWLLEGVLLFWAQRRAVSFRETLLLSLAMNVASFVVGLFVTV
jgi:hypothetical protein